MADDDVKLSESEKEAIVDQASKASEAVVKSRDKEKVNDVQDAVASIAPDATFEQTKDELTIKVPLGSEEEKQKLIDKFVAQKLSAAQAEAERIAEEKVKAEIEKMAREKLEAAKKKAAEPEPVAPAPAKEEAKKPAAKKAEPAAKSTEPVVKSTAKKAPASKPAAKPAAKKVASTPASGNLKVVLVKSLIGTLPNQRKTAKALGLSKKISSYSIRPNNAVTRGMIDVVKHLVRVEEI